MEKILVRSYRDVREMATCFHCTVCRTVGDGVVPLCSGHVPDAIQLTLDGVLHSINAPENWYGSDSILDQWHETMLAEVERMQAPVMGIFQLNRIFQ